MECPKCNKKVSELDEKCPYCGLDFEIYEKEKNIKKENYESGYKTVALRLINAFQLICCIIIAFVNWSNEKIIAGFTFLFSGIVLFAFIKGFSDIIDLLDSINGKLDNK